MRFMVRTDGSATLYRGQWDAPICEFAPGWGLGLSLEFPSDWHEHQHAVLYLCLLWGKLWLHIPWFRKYPDHWQCSGPCFGFNITSLGEGNGPMLFLYYGNDDGTPKGSRVKIIYGPWSWGASVRRDEVFAGVTPFAYTLKSGEVQKRQATVKLVEQEWRRWWLPWRNIWRGIDVAFDAEVGERTGSWKGGVLGCGYESKPGETWLDTLRRMERERPL